MKIDSVNNCSFGAKNTFLKKAKNAATKQERINYMSDHYEAKGTCHYLKFLNLSSKIASEPKIVSAIDAFKYTKMYFGMVYHKLASVGYSVKSAIQ